MKTRSVVRMLWVSVCVHSIAYAQKVTWKLGEGLSNPAYLAIHSQRFWFSRTGLGPRTWIFNKLLEWFSCRWSGDAALRNAAVSQRKGQGNIHPKQKSLFVLCVSLSDFLKWLAERHTNLTSYLTFTYAEFGSSSGIWPSLAKKQEYKLLNVLCPDTWPRRKGDYTKRLGHVNNNTSAFCVVVDFFLNYGTMCHRI